jgi:hypothetical protein
MRFQAKIGPPPGARHDVGMQASGDLFFERVFFSMKTLTQKIKTNDPSKPIWCARCYVRIAPSERHAVKSGKTYHQGCYSKLQEKDHNPKN